MRALYINLLMIFAIQAVSGQLVTTVSVLVSDTQVKLVKPNFTGQIEGMALAGKCEFSPDW